MVITTTVLSTTPIQTISFKKSETNVSAETKKEVQYVECDPNGTKQHEMGAKLDAHKAKSGVLGDFGRALMAVSEVGTFGIKKYARGSWQHVPDGVERYTDALWRHLLQENKESTDPDSGLPHEFHVAWNALARLELLLRKREVNINLHTTDKATEET